MEYRTDTCGIGFSPCGSNPPFLGLTCAYVKDPQLNTKDNVTKFILSSVNDAGIDCTSQLCQVEDLGKTELDIPQFSRKLVYFEKPPTRSADEYVEIAKQEAQKSTNSFQEAGWGVNIQDTTQQESTWSGNQKVSISLKVTATNQKFSCSHTITILGSSKREIVSCGVILPGTPPIGPDS